jgi:hypothetical protein
MAERIVAAEWRNNNEQVRYPFVDTASLQNEKGTVVLDQDMFDDARIYPIGAAVGVYLTKILVEGKEVTFTVGDPVNGDLASGGYNALSAPSEIALYDSYARPAGVLVSNVEKLGSLADQLPQGETVFEAGSTEFVASVVIPLPHVGVRGFLLDDGNVLTGDVWLVGEQGVVLSYADGAIRVDVIGDPYALIRDCEEQGQPLPVFNGLKTLNEIEPNEHGDFKLLVGGNLSEKPVFRITTLGGGRLEFKLVGTSGVKEV